MKSKFFDLTTQKDASKARIILRMNFGGGSVCNYIYDYPYRSYDYIYEALQKDYSNHNVSNTMQIQFSGTIENRQHEEEFDSFNDLLSFLRKNNLTVSAQSPISAELN